ncbi:hypothetical protein VUR80DRAFT_9950 [Thermomyces stellatus]
MACDVREEPVARQPPELYTGTRRRFALVNRPMAVRVSVRFFDPVNVDFARSYETSRDFKPTPEICSALLRRLEHCSEELITRKDASALEPGPDKPARFEVAFQLSDAPSTVKERTFTSYQANPPTMDQATDVILATDRMVGLFLIRHDKDFKWAKGPVREFVSGKPKTAKPNTGGPESLACVPRCRFFPSTQSYEFVPGYEIELHFNSTCSTRRPQKLSKTIRLSSSQCSPLTRPFGEEMLSAASKAVHAAIDSRKRALIGFRWLSAMSDTLSIDLRIKNNLGPDYDDLTYTLDSKQSLFSSPNGLDCIMFLDEIYRSLARVRDRVDDAIGATNELEVKVLELRGSKWEAAEPLSIFLDPTISYSRRTVEAILDRVQTGVASILHGNDNSITLSVLHRGHLVLDKTLVAHEDPAVVKRPPLAMAPEHEGNVVIAKLAQRIQSDIAMVCKDTCALDSRGDALPNLRVIQKSHAIRTAEPIQAETPRRSAVRQPLVYTPPPSSHSNRTKKDAVSAKEDNRPRGSSIASSSTPPPPPLPPRTPRNNMRRRRHEDMDLTPPPTPSLVDGDLETPRDSMLITPPPDTKHGRGGSEVSSYDPQIVDDDASISDPIVRDFAHLASHVEPFSKECRSEPLVPMSKSDRPFGVALVPDTPNRVRNVVIASESEVEGLQNTPSKVAAPVKEVAAKGGAVAPDKRQMTKDNDTGVGTMNQNSKGTAEPVLEGWLEYRCDPLDPHEQASEDLLPSTQEQTLAESETTSKPILEGWLEYSCEPLGVISEEPEPPDLPLEGWLEYWCEPLEEEEGASSEAVLEDLESTESPVLEGWLEYWCEPLDPEEETKEPTPEAILPAAVAIGCPSITVTEENTSLLDHQQTPPSGGNTPAAAGPPPSLAVETFDPDSGTKSCSEAAYTNVGCTGKELHEEVAAPSSTATVFVDVPEAPSLGGVAPPPLDERPVSRKEGEQDANIGQSTDVQRIHEIDDMEGAPLLPAAESLTYGSLDGHHEKGPYPMDDQDCASSTTSDDSDSGGVDLSTPDDETLPAFIQGEAAAKGKEVVVELDSGQPGESSLKAEDDELTQAIAEIDTAVARTQEAAQLKDATAEAQESREIDDEIAQAVAEIDAAVERHAAEQLAKDNMCSYEAVGDWDSESEFEISAAVAEIDAAVERAAREKGGAPVGAETHAFQADEEDIDIDRAVAEIDAAVKSRETASREEKARRVLETALKEKDSFEIARAIAEIDAAVEKGREEQEVKGRPKPVDTPKTFERAFTHDAAPPPLPPRPSRRLSLAGPPPNSLLLRPTSTLESFPPLRTNSLPPPDRSRTGVPFAGPAPTRKNSVPLAGNVGLHNDYLFPLQDALLGTHSSDGFFGTSSSRASSHASSHASPVLSPLTAECKSGVPDPPRGTRRETKAEVAAKASLETDDKKKARGETPSATPKSGYGAFPGFMFWAAGVTIASSVFRRA